MRSGGLASGSRREALLAAAIRLFDERGYHGFSMEDIGGSIGIAAASVYNHFASKSDLLVAALTRAAGTLQLGTSRALAGASTPHDALQEALGSYTQFALSHSHLVGALVSEVMNLPDAQRHEIRRLQPDYVSEWVRLLVAARPEIPEAAARFIVHGVLTVINDTCRTQHLRRPGLERRIHGLARDLLFET